jgi:hypothetical protein
MPPPLNSNISGVSGLMYLSIYSSRFEIFFGESKTAGDFSFIFPHQSVEAKKNPEPPPRHNAHKISGTLGVSVCL